MTTNQKKLWDMLPPGEWVNRELINKEYGWGFQLALTYLYGINIIELEFKTDGQYIRRKTIDEIAKMTLKINKK